MTPERLLVGLLVLVALCTTSCDTERPRGPSAALMGQPAPVFDLPVVAGTGASEGDRVSLEALRGRVVVLDFWASWCFPCRQSIPALNEVHARYGEGVKVLGVNVEGNLPRPAVVDAHRRFGARFPSVQDIDGQVQAAYRVQNIPMLVLIDTTGVVRWVEVGVPDPNDVARRIDDLLDEKRAGADRVRQRVDSVRDSVDPLEASG